MDSRLKQSGITNNGEKHILRAAQDDAVKKDPVPLPKAPVQNQDKSQIKGFEIAGNS